MAGRSIRAYPSPPFRVNCDMLLLGVRHFFGNRIANFLGVCVAVFCLWPAGLVWAQPPRIDHPAYREPQWGQADREHWAYLPLRAVSPPPVRTTDWARTPVDRFILARLEERGLRPAREADLAVLGRRSSLDLLGVPPTARQLQRLLADR